LSATAFLQVYYQSIDRFHYMHPDHRLLVIWVGAMVRENARATNDNPFYTDCN
jgi:hypothetical protein